MIRITHADAVVIALALALLPYLYFTYWGAGTHGEQARILIAGKEFALVWLHEDRRITVPGTLGPSLLEIHDGKIRFVTSPCRGKQCVRSGWVSLSGEVAVCLPNRISVQVVGHDPRYDAINF